jgi:hypothetical protein
MKTLSFTVDAKTVDGRLAQIKDMDPSLICLFFSPEHAEDGLLKKISELYKTIPVVGCSTAGEMSSEGYSQGGVSIVAIHFDDTEVRAVSETLPSSQHSRKTACSVAGQLKGEGLTGILMLAPGLNINGSEVCYGMQETVGEAVTIFGGLAADNANFKETFTFINGSLANNTLVAVGFYGDKIKIQASSKGGWKPFGPSRRVTKSVGNILYELDNKPALDLYKEYLGDKAADLPASGLLYPFSILDSNSNQTGLVRTILDINHDEKSLVLAGDIHEGSLVCLMHSDVDALIGGAAAAAQDLEINSTGDSSVAFLVSCVGRSIVMADEVEEELEVVQDILGKNVALTGFYSYGEICPFVGTKKSELHNQTMTIAHLSETA